MYAGYFPTGLSPADALRRDELIRQCRSSLSRLGAVAGWRENVRCGVKVPATANRGPAVAVALTSIVPVTRVNCRVPPVTVNTSSNANPLGIDLTRPCRVPESRAPLRAVNTNVAAIAQGCTPLVSTHES